jgi:hypothetical protein
MSYPAYTIDEVYNCSKIHNGLPSLPNSSTTTPKNTNYHNCRPSTAPWNPDYNSNWKNCQLYVNNSQGNFKIKGTIPNVSSGTKVKYWASAPLPCMYSISGLGLPFPNEEVAYENTPNKGVITLDNTGKFEIKIRYPGGYYINQGETYIAPHVNFMICDGNPNNIIKLQLPFEPPFRSLGFNLANHSREFQPVPFKKQ